MRSRGQKKRYIVPKARSISPKSYSNRYCEAEPVSPVGSAHLLLSEQPIDSLKLRFEVHDRVRRAVGSRREDQWSMDLMWGGGRRSLGFLRALGYRFALAGFVKLSVLFCLSGPPIYTVMAGELHGIRSVADNQPSVNTSAILTCRLRCHHHRSPYRLAARRPCPNPIRRRTHSGPMRRGSDYTLGR